MSARRPTAVERTVPMPGVDLREQWDRNELDLRGTPLIKIVLEDPAGMATVLGAYSTHLASVLHRDRPLCGVKLRPAPNEPVGKTICGACRAAAGSRELGQFGGLLR